MVGFTPPVGHQPPERARRPGNEASPAGIVDVSGTEHQQARSAKDAAPSAYGLGHFLHIPHRPVRCPASGYVSVQGAALVFCAGPPHRSAHNMATLGVSTTTYDCFLSGPPPAVLVYCCQLPQLCPRPVRGVLRFPYRGNGQASMVLRNFPITAVASCCLRRPDHHRRRRPGGAHQRRPLRRPRADAGRLPRPPRPAGGGQLHGRLRHDAARHRLGPPSSWSARRSAAATASGLASKSLGGQEVIAFSLKDMEPDMLCALLAPYQAPAPLLMLSVTLTGAERARAPTGRTRAAVIAALAAKSLPWPSS